MRILLDTNILISALISRGGPAARLFDAWMDDDAFTLLMSEVQLTELRRVMDYDHIKKLTDPVRVEEYLRNLDTACMVEGHVTIDASIDPDDNLILGAAVAGKADLIVSRDEKHMLVLGEIQGIPIVNAVDAIKRLQV